MTNLPPELLSSIATTRGTYLSLALVNKHYNSIVNPILYKGVELRKYDALRAFSRTLVSGRPILREYPVYLYIAYNHSSNPVEPDDLGPTVKQILMHVPNLKHLRLASTTTGNPLGGYLVDGSRYPFTLRKLEMNPPKELIAEFIEFLRAQPEIENVALSKGDSQNRPNWHINASLPSDILPKLRSIRSDGATISFIIPHHPVSRVVLTGTLRDVLGVHKALAKSLKPLERLTERIELRGYDVPWESGILSCFSSLEFSQKSLSSYSLEFELLPISRYGYHGFSTQSFLKASLNRARLS